MANEKLLKLLSAIADAAQSIARQADSLKLDVLFECGAKICEEERESIVFDLADLAELGKALSEMGVVL